MGSEWPLLSLGETCYITDGAHAKVERQSEGVLYLTSKNFDVGSLKLDKVDYISEEDFQRLFTNTKKSQRCLKSGDILTGIIGTFGNAYRYKDSDYFGISSSVAILRPDHEKLDSDYLYYVVTSPAFKATVAAYKGGSVQGYTNIATLKTLPVPMPDLKAQRSIAKILGGLDNKIQLNRQTNQTLEQMAQALFKSWFVDFDPVIDNALAAGNSIPEELQARAQRRQQQLAKPDHQPLPDDVRQLFPSEFEETEALGWVPKGWRVSNIKSFGRVVTGKTPPKSVEGAYDEVGFPFITPTDIDDSIFVAKVNRYLSDKGASVINKNKIPKGSVCVSCIGSQMGKTVISPTAAYTNQQINSVVVTDDFSRNYLFYNLRGRREELFSLGASGSTMPILNKSSFEKLLVLKPSDRILRKYQEFTGEQMESVYQRFIQIESLENLRNTLLPKLISGELRLPESLLDSETNPPETAYE
jgi:type I restriction enzyme S subunit